MRWLKFNAVGIMGWVVHLGCVTLLVHGLGMQYLWATGLAVELAIIHNFLWHRRWTWSDRSEITLQPFAAFLRFNVSNGAVSIFANLTAAWLLTGFFGVDPVLSNVASSIPFSLVNFFIAHRLVFAPSSTK